MKPMFNRVEPGTAFSSFKKYGEHTKTINIISLLDTIDLMCFLKYIILIDP